MDRSWVESYLQRIGASGHERGGIEALRDLQLAHLRAVPFENLSIHLGEPIVLNPETLVDKIVERNRGGFCYELNGAFATLLEALGFQVAILAARVYGPSGLGPPFDHMALRVELEHPWLVDVGFGAFAHYPVRIDTNVGQPDPAGVVRVERAADGDLDVLLDGQLQYRLDIRPYNLADFVPTCWWQATSPHSDFTRSVTCSVLTDSGRVTLSGAKLIVTKDGSRQEQLLGSDTEILDAYRSHFGISLERVPVLTGRSLR
jgi:N-hydroxyarylamine O-acetyltransferase